MLSYVIFSGLLMCLYLLSQTLTRQLSFLFYHVFKNQNASMYALALILFPGVLVHELSHFIVAVLTGVHAQNMEFFPKVVDGRLKLGSVQIEKTDPFRKTLIGVAPLIGGLSLLLFLMYLFRVYFPHSIPAGIVVGILYYQISNTMFSSKKDLEGTWVFFAVFLVLILLLWFFGAPIVPFFLESEFGVMLQELLSKGSFYLAVACGIDVIIAGVLYLLTRVR